MVDWNPSSDAVTADPGSAVSKVKLRRRSVTTVFTTVLPFISWTIGPGERQARLIDDDAHDALRPRGMGQGEPDEHHAEG